MGKGLGCSCKVAKQPTDLLLEKETPPSNLRRGSFMNQGDARKLLHGELGEVATTLAICNPYEIDSRAQF